MIRGLPYDAELEYLESTGTQWIDTGIVASYVANIAIDMSVALTSLRGASVSTFYLFGGSTSYDNGITIGCDSASTTQGIRCTNGLLVGSEIYPATGFMYNLHLDDEKFSVNNKVVGFTRTDNGFVSGTTLLFGTRRGSSVRQISLSSCRMESCKMYSNGTLIRDYIPVRFMNEQGQTEGAMYDKVSSQLFRNQGTGAFVLGPDKMRPVPVISLHSYGASRFGKIGAGARMVRYSYDAEVEYLESTGTQWIDTGWSPSNYPGFTLDFQCTHLDSPSSDYPVYLGSQTSWDNQSFGLLAPVNSNGRLVFHRAISGGNPQRLATTFRWTLERTTAQLDTNGRLTIVSATQNYSGDIGTREIFNMIPVLLFRRNSDYDTVCTFRCFALRLTSAGYLVRDFIPVRFTNELGASEGAMYDKVSGELFRNAGTGAFVVGPDKLPYDADVEYLETTGTQWIDTGIRLSSQTDEVDAIFYSTTSSNRIIFGSRTSANSQNFGCAWGSNGEILVDVNNGNYSTSRAATQNASPTGLYTIHASRQERIISGPAQATNTTLADIFTTAHNCYLFYGSGNFWTTQKFVGRFYSFTVKRNGALIRDFIPVRVGTIGYMYDRVSKQLFGNSGTGAFVVGPDKYDAELEYLESTGTQWIDTGVYASLSTIVQLRFLNVAQTGDIIFGAYNSNDNTDYRLFNASQGLYFDAYNGRLNKASALNINIWRELELGNYYVKDLATGEELLRGTTGTGNLPDATLKLNHYVNGSTQTNSQNRWAYVKIYNDDVLVRDFIPVRVGTAGYMYDRVSNRLFGNSGTGNFILGPDISSNI